MSDVRPATDTVRITLNGKEVDVRKDEQLIDAAERHGVYIPRFCYHPRMTAVGKCRQCIVEVDTGRGMALQPSCMLKVSDGMVVDTDSELSKQVQEGVLEHLLINHPLDCPVCDKGGECPLQDQAYSHGPGESRFVEEKRHFEKPIPISPIVTLDRERCILCDRCTRFADEVAGDPLIHFIDRGNATQVNTFPDDPFASYFSGNTVQICPVGALTATPYRFKARPWDLEKEESTCQSCSVGCRITVQTSRNRVLRYEGVDSDPVNWSWLCDKGRFGFESIHSEDRIAAPLRRAADGELAPVRWAEALDAAADAISSAIAGSGPESVAVLGGSRLTNESAYAWAKLAKGVIGTDNVDAQLGDGLPADLVLGLPRATIDQACTPGGTIVLLGPDPKETLPVLFLRLRHAVVHDGARLVEITPTATGLSSLAAASVHPTPGHTAEVVRALLDGDTAKAVGGVEPDALVSAAELLRTDGPLTIVVGRGSLAESADVTVEAAAVLHDACPDARFLPGLRRSNVMGALDMGLAPGLLPGRVLLEDGRDWILDTWESAPSSAGLDAAGILTAAAEGRIDTLVLLGADPLADFPDADLAARALAGARTVVALDRFVTDSVAKADVVLPVAGFAETDGTTTNIEGRVSVLAQRVTPPGSAQPDWSIAVSIARRLGADLGFESPEDIWNEVLQVSGVHAGVSLDVLRRRANADGVVVPPAPTEVSIGGVRTSEVDEVEAASPDADASAPPADGNMPPSDPDAPGDIAPGTDEAAEPIDTTTDAAEGAELGEQVAEQVEEAVAEGDAGDRPEADDPSSPVSPGPARPEALRFVAPAATAVPGPVDAYSLRLVTVRTLYDRGTQLTHSPSLNHLAAGPAVRLHPADFDKVGVAAGTEVRVTSPSGSVVLPVHPDVRVPRGRAAVNANQSNARVHELLDATAVATDVRVEVL
ncbi:NADH-quinone oxidoreductase subunit NuoG [Actinomarinicola tropica]|uniref:NADH-quinone oxidoreductase n=1 Tax=Actinomarinicola tropica TaxID=2789776 RepID=A0A5Q2RII8_9ACTN|nr:NADH-quinone oxidoreductase subunit NuoG [Actinomarinicola tropica]QGG93807.1 NADH-quinone oxidoreductase subunit NuoG [Actinomarinicola tropica]